MAPLRSALLILAITACVAAGGVADAGGSFGVQFVPLELRVDIDVEQQIAQVYDGWVWIGGGVAFSAEAGMERLTPYALWCREHDLLIAWGEFCIEAEVPVVGEGDWVRLHYDISW